MKKILVSSFYKYIYLDHLEEFQKEHLEFCKNLDIKGKILISKEGINGTVSGIKDQIYKYETNLLSHKEFSDLKFKRTLAEIHPFRKTIVRIRNEIVSSGFGISAKNFGKHISPYELNKLYDNKEDFVIVDARNNYESKIGRFKNAVTPDIETFREFKTLVKQLEGFKNKKVVLYCTGGVRCEKASALLINEGFKDVNQVDGGIINYIQQYPGIHFEGRCFVFDDRSSIETGDSKDITICERCHEPCGEYINCFNIRCDKLFVCCRECREKFYSTCSKECRNLVNSI